MPVYFFTDGDGAQCFLEADRKPRYAEGRVPRMPGPFERWVDGAWIIDEDAKLVAEMTPADIADARRQKAEEARRILSGEAQSGELIEQEAKLRGITTRDLAEIVQSKVDERNRREIARQAVSLRKV